MPRPLRARDVDTVPAGERIYRAHGLFLRAAGSSQSVGDCFLCGREGKWYCNTNTGLWDCKSCGASGNPLSFLQQLWKASDQRTSDYESLATERGLLYPETLLRWGVCRSVITGEWLVPGHDAAGKLCQLYRYVEVPGGDRKALLASPGFGHGLLGMPGYERDRGTIYLCEGLWDGMALWEVMGAVKLLDRELVPTGNAAVSLLAEASVLSVPACTVFMDKWTALGSKRRVILMYDNDHPRKNPKTGAVTRPASDGMKRVAGLLASGTDGAPEEINYLEWGKDGYDPVLPDGYDVRDAMKAGGTSLQGKAEALAGLLAKVAPIPDDWVQGRARKAVKKGSAELECLPCQEWKVLRDAWRKALRWIPGLDRALATMLATVTSTESVGDQLWVKIIGPPSCGKSVLCEALAVNRKYCMPKSTIRGLFSGYQVDREGVEDTSLAPQLKNKTLITKDGDTLLQMPNLPQILAEFRDLYDRVSRTHYRNKMSRDYEGLSVTWILCGTESLRYLDSSELGERLLDCVIADTLEAEVEDAIALRKAYQADRELAYKSDGHPETRDSPEMVLAKQLTGGYVEYLRENAQDLLARVEAPDAALRYCVTLGTLVAYMRARPSKRQDETAQRELSFRLVSQHVRLAKCLAVVLNRRTLDDEVMARVRQVALDTARGRTLTVIRYLAEAGDKGLSAGWLANACHSTDDKKRTYLTFLRRIGAVELFTSRATPESPPRQRWRLTERLSTLYHEVFPTHTETGHG